MFPEADIFGVKLINGRHTKSLVTVTNNEESDIKVMIVAGTLNTLQELPPDAPAYQGIIANLSSTTYQVAIAPGESTELAYSFVLDMNPQDVQLKILAAISDSAGNIFQFDAHKGTASIVEAPTNIFDPQMYAFRNATKLVRASAVANPAYL